MNGIQVTYTELCTLSVEQLFYQNKVCRQYKINPVTDFAFTPTPECRALMLDMDLLFRPTDTSGGFTILANVSGKTGGGNDLLRYAVKKGAKLSFFLQLRNPELINFNDLPLLGISDQVYYFSNIITDAGAPRNSLHLTKSDTGVAEADSMHSSGPAYSFHQNAPVTAGTSIIKHLLTGATIAEKTLVNQNGEADLGFDLRRLPTGVCELWINHVKEDTFYYRGLTINTPVWGVVELSLSSVLDANYRLVEADRSLTPDRPQYMLRFVNRSTIWRYTVQLGANSPLYLEMAGMSPADKATYLDQLNIVSNDTNVHFHRAAVTDKEIEFVSDNALALQEKYVSSSANVGLILNLKKYIGDPKETVVKANLPYPATGTIDTTTDPFIYSDIFLTL
ncbi:hypothetical protein F0L74_24020 [Chitinophaga agrisoli]|uniref:Uncharacterized protein n=1 Tax=Chitinophaga agrisoli TaxID=2607653 RepID=A0A5B2VL79_9BACT|nr:hypothetical protein [Chitinophaga agrisoli]KAA2239276.1 hypothetical protein F0L74_24020 [Chitinophaga agrisoli]